MAWPSHVSTAFFPLECSAATVSKRYSARLLFRSRGGAKRYRAFEHCSKLSHAIDCTRPQTHRTIEFTPVGQTDELSNSLRRSCSTTSKANHHVDGTLDMLILRTLRWGPTHGHDIAKHIQRSTDDVLQVEHGSLYRPCIAFTAKAGFRRAGSCTRRASANSSTTG